MLPTQGLFRSIPCPYYISGLCERPQCLFRHTKSDVILARKVEIEEEDREATDESGGEEDSTRGVTTIDTKQPGTITTGKKRKAEQELVLKQEKPNKAICLDVGVGEVKVKKELFELVDLTDETTEVDDKSSSSPVKKEKTRTSSSSKKSSSHKSSSSSTSKSKSSRDSSSDRKKSSHSKSHTLSPSRSEKEDKYKKKEDSSPHKKHSSSDSSTKHRSHSSSSSSSNTKAKEHKSSHKSSSRSSSSSTSTKSKSTQRVSLFPFPFKSYKNTETTPTTTTSAKNNNSDSAKDKGDNKKDSPLLPPPPDNDDAVEIVQDPSCDVEAFSDYDEDDPDDIELECLRLFENYKPEEKVSEKIVIGNSTPELDSSHQKKRQAHPGAERSAAISASQQQLSAKTHHKTSSSLHSIISKRLESQRSNSSSSSNTGIISIKPLESLIEPQYQTSTSFQQPPSAQSNKKRIAHVANVTGLLKPSSSITSVPDKSTHNISSNTSDSNNKTIPKTTTKGTNRVAHSSSSVSTQSIKKRPIVHLDSPSKGSGKIPATIRQKVLDQLFDAAVIIYSNSPNNNEAFERAVRDEAAIEVRSKTKAVYLSLAVGKVRAIRKEAEEGPPPEITGSATVTGLLLENEQFTRPRPSQKDNFSILTRTVVRPTGTALYQALKRFMLTEDLLLSNGFPRPHPTNEPGRAVAQRVFWDKEYTSEPTKRTCDRCRRIYDVTEFGQQLREETCTFHPGRKSYHRVNRVWISQRSCCGDESSSAGCTTVNFHVPKSHPVSATRGFVSAVKGPGEEEHMGLDPWDVIAIDCEMVYTTGGNLLARATFIGSDGRLLYDQLVKPPFPVLDYNTEYSGLTADMMSRATTTLTDVQAVLLAYLKPNALIIGHSLESDLIALRVKHDYVVDTSILYPHKRGPPYKRGLRVLSSDYLHKIIQESAHGHDSAEDARAALELSIHHIERSRNNGDV